MDIYSFSSFGYEGALVKVEADLRRGIPAVTMVGLPDSAVRESRERMRAAIRNSHLEFPKERILINLSPADVKKAGSGFDLAIALAVLCADNAIDKNTVTDCIVVIGELELSGAVRSVHGITAALSAAYEANIRYCIVPFANAAEAYDVPHMHVYAVKTLVEAFHYMYHPEAADTTPRLVSDMIVQSQATFVCPYADAVHDFGIVKQQAHMVRALEIAVAGRHNILIFGPAGCGKTLALSCVPSILPSLTEEEAHEVSRIYSVGNHFATERRPSLYEQPFRSPHHSASVEGMIGGGIHCAPGEISLAHNGVLFLDEACEFRSNVLQSLRVPLETGSIRLSRAGRSTCFPADFQLIMAANPCPCGNFGSPKAVCICHAQRVEAYWHRLSSPLLDRIDVRVPVYHTSSEKASNGCESIKTTSSADLRESVGLALQWQKKRGLRNRDIGAHIIDTYCSLGKSEQVFLADMKHVLYVSQRAVHSILKVARTIADLADCEHIKERHLQEAMELRRFGDSPWEML